MPTIIHAMICICNEYPVGNASHDIAVILLTHYKQIIKMSLAEVADLCFTSQATISRFIKSIGCRTFSDFKANITESIEGYQYLNRCMPYELSIKKPLPDSYIDFFQDCLEQIRKSYDHINVDKIVDTMFHSSRISIYSNSTRESSIIQLQYDLVMAGIQTAVYDSPEMQEYDAKHLKNGSMVIAIYRNNIKTSYMRKLLAIARSNGRKTLIIAPPNTPKIKELSDFLIEWNSTGTAADNFIINFLIALLSMTFRDKHLEQD